MLPSQPVNVVPWIPSVQVIHVSYQGVIIDIIIERDILWNSDRFLKEQVIE